MGLSYVYELASEAVWVAWLLLDWYDHLNICTYRICMDSCTDTFDTPLFILDHECLLQLNLRASDSLEELHELFQTTELSGASPRPNCYPPITGRLISCVHVQQSFTSFILHPTNQNGPLRLLRFTWWLPFIRLSKMKLPTSFGFLCF